MVPEGRQSMQFTLEGKGRITVEEKREILAGILQSKSFQRAPKLSHFLRFICEREIEDGSGAAVHEQDIGRAVYQRRDDYSPSEDNIVRVEARNLRRKLDDFFREEGLDLPILVRVPKGTYLPEFERRSPAAEPAPSVQIHPAPSVAPSAPNVKRFGGTERIAIGTLLVLLIILSVTLFIQNRVLQSRLQTSQRTFVENPLWPRLFDDHHHTRIVLSDSGFVLMQDLLKRHLSLSDYLNRPPGMLLPLEKPTSETERAVALVNSPRLTGFAGARFAASVLGLPGIMRNRVTVRSARDLSPLDFKESHIILVGSVRSNPWIEMFEPKLSFRYEFDHERSQAIIRNADPRPGELVQYRVGGGDGKSNEIYSTLALLPNLSRDGNVLIVSGTGTEGTESACEMLLNPDLISRTVRELNLAKNGTTQYFEVLLQSSRVGNTSNGAKILAHRTIDVDR